MQSRMQSRAQSRLDDRCKGEVEVPADEVGARNSAMGRIREKIVDLLEEVESLDRGGEEGQRSLLHYMAEMAEENRELSKKCRELACTVKTLRQSERMMVRKQSFIKSRAVGGDDDDSFDGDDDDDDGGEKEARRRRRDRTLARHEKERSEMQDELQRLRSELAESKGRVQLLTAQLVTYKEDFEMERSDRERAMEKIEVLETRLFQADMARPQVAIVHRTLSSQPESFSESFEIEHLPPSSSSPPPSLLHRPDHLQSQHQQQQQHHHHHHHHQLNQQTYRIRAGGFNECNGEAHTQPEVGYLVPRGSLDFTDVGDFDDCERYAPCWSSSHRIDREIRKVEQTPSGDRPEELQSLVERSTACGKNKRKLDHRHSFDKAFSEKLPILE